MIRAGKNGIYVNDFLFSGVVALDCSSFGTISSNISPDEIATQYMKLNPSKTKIQARNTISQINRFVHSISIGDRALTYEPNKRIYYIGIVESDTFMYPKIVSKLSCARYVTWTEEVSRDKIDPKFISSLGALLTVFHIKDETVENALKSAQPIRRVSD